MYTDGQDGAMSDPVGLLDDVVVGAAVVPMVVGTKLGFSMGVLLLLLLILVIGPTTIPDNLGFCTWRVNRTEI